MYKCYHALLVTCLALFLAFPTLAASKTKGQQEEATLEQLQTTYQGLHSLQFTFAQVTDSGGRVKEGNGSAAFYRSGLSGTANSGVMRWDYEAPSQQVILNNGRELSIYTPQDKQLIISPIQDLDADITFALFTGSRKLTDEFAASEPDPVFFINDPPGNMQAIQLVPKQPHPQLKRIQIWVDSHHVLHRLLMEDHFGALTELDFSDIQFNGLPARDSKQEQRLLKLDLAPGTEIIRQ